jgi:hypothetical protein
MKSKRFIPKTYLVLFFFVLISFILLVFPLSSLAKLQPLKDNFSMSWGVEPPGWFRINSVPTRPTTVWFDVDITGSEVKEEKPIAKIRTEEDPPLREIIDKGLLALFPPETPFLDVHDYDYCWCDDDGLADKGGQISPANTTTAGCVAVETHAEKVTRSGDAVVETPPGSGGVYWNTDGAPFIKIYFPEEVTATLSEWHAKINYTDDCSNLNNHNTLGTLHVSNMKVTIYPGGWTQIWVQK